MRTILRKGKILFQTGFFHIFSSAIIKDIVSFLSIILLVRILTKEEYGIFTYAWNIYNMALLFTGMGMANAILQLASERSGNTEYAISVTYYGTRFGLRFNLLIVLVMIIIGAFVPLKIKGSGCLLLLLCLLPSLQFLFAVMAVYLRSQKRNQDYASLVLLNTVLIAVFSAVGAYLFREIGLVLSHYIACFLSLLFGVVALHVHLFHKDRELETLDKKAMLPIAFISMCNNSLSSLLYLLDVFVLGIVVPKGSVLASYKTATLIPTGLAFIPLALVTYIYPYFAEHRDDGSWCLKRYKQIIAVLGGFNFCISLVLYTMAPITVKLVFGAKYLDAVPIFRILVVNYFFSGTFRIIAGNLLVTQRKLMFNLIVAVGSGVVNIIADYFFIQWWGAIGAALATVLVVLITGVSNTGYLIYTFKQGIKSRGD